MGEDISGVTGADTISTMVRVPTAADGIHTLQVDGHPSLWQAERAHW